MTRANSSTVIAWWRWDWRCQNWSPYFSVNQRGFGPAYSRNNSHGSCGLYVWGQLIGWQFGLFHESNNALIPYATVHHFITELHTTAHFRYTNWCIVGYLFNALWDLVGLLDPHGSRLIHVHGGTDKVMLVRVGAATPDDIAKSTKH